MNHKYQPAIVVPAFKRINSLKRLLSSINSSWFPSGDIRLIISLDGGKDEEILNVVHSFKFDHGKVELIERDENLGVKDHILKCAELSHEFGSVIVLEDDLVVAPAFYEYAMRALSFYDGDTDIAGISLYSQRYNETAALPFEPLENEWSVYFMQLGCSWGQAWTSDQWTEFENWRIDERGLDLLEEIELPKNILDWPESSWKKLFNCYLVSTDRYIVYPYSSFTTNHSKQGGHHMRYVKNRFQVPLNTASRLNNSDGFIELMEDSIKYDVFMEPQWPVIGKWVSTEKEKIEMDLYGKKPIELLQRKPFAITSKKVNHYNQSFPLDFRPLELNIKFGSDSKKSAFFYFVETASLSGTEKLRHRDYFRFFEYFIYGTIKTFYFARLYFLEISSYIPERMRILFYKNR